jgi:autotransporter-associated beta strand protein
MKHNLTRSLTCAVILAAVAPATHAAVFFSDTFGSGSTINSPTPVAPTATSAAYQMLSTKNQTPAPSISPGNLRFGIASTSSGVMEIQALFASDPIALVMPGDNIQLVIVFTNTSGILPANSGSSQLGIGLYNSGNIEPFTPLPGGTNASTLRNLSDYTQKWQGYIGQIVASSSRIFTRPSQINATDGWNQELVLTGSQTSTYRGQTGVGSAVNTAVTLTTGATYTQVLSITRTEDNNLAITNTLHAGPDTSGTVVVSSGGIASGGTLLTSGFNGLAFGYQAKVSGAANTIDVSSIEVSGSVTGIAGPPEIVQQPVSASAPLGSACAFDVEASGFSMTYQWHRHGTNLVDDDNTIGSQSSRLIVSPVTAEDLSSTYYVTITGAGGYSTNSVNVSLSQRTAANLTWSGSHGTWDLNTTPAWSPGEATFNYGDNVTFDDTGWANTYVTLDGSFLSASSVTVNNGYDVTYVFAGAGSFAGPGSLNYKGAGILRIDNANTYSGGTIISNELAYLKLQNYQGLGTGPVRFSKAGGLMEIVPTGGTSTGIAGDVVVEDDFKIQIDGTGSYGAVFFGDLSGVSGKTLTLDPYETTNTCRVRLAGSDTVYDANLHLVDSTVQIAFYQPSGGVQIYNGVISGPGSLIQRAGGLTVLNGANTFAGGTDPTTGTIAVGRDTVGPAGAVTSGPLGTGPLLLDPEASSVNGAIQAWGGARTIANAIQYSSGTNNHTLTISGTNALTLTGGWSLQGQDGLGGPQNRTNQVNNTALTTIAGVISDGGLGYGFTKTGTGVLALINVQTYTGPTTVSAGTLQVNGSLAAASAVTVATNGILGGTGTIGGSVTVNQGGALAPGASVGVLNVGGNLALAGNLDIEVNKALSPMSDKVNVTGTINSTGTGTVTVTNLGTTALQTGDTFVLFNKPVTGGASLNVTGGGSSVTWTNKLAIDGTIQVVSVLPTTPTNMTYSVSGNILTLSWPASYTGYLLQSNAVGVSASSSWYDVPGSGANNSYPVTIDPAKGNVFYRLLKP